MTVVAACACTAFSSPSVISGLRFMQLIPLNTHTPPLSRHWNFIAFRSSRPQCNSGTPRKSRSLRTHLGLFLPIFQRESSARSPQGIYPTRGGPPSVLVLYHQNHPTFRETQTKYACVQNIINFLLGKASRLSVSYHLPPLSAIGQLDPARPRGSHGSREGAAATLRLRHWHRVGKSVKRYPGDAAAGRAEAAVSHDAAQEVVAEEVGGEEVIFELSAEFGSSWSWSWSIFVEYTAPVGVRCGWWSGSLAPRQNLLSNIYI
mmetsp:Transcript_9299/g.18960  ORF Transcript_9299/g.18960 Transcript_9299/m.18960 type:complete len:261 (+) Transcript_9299:306-1088(+)